MKTVAQTVIEADRFYTIAAKGGSVIQAVEKATNGGDIRLGKYEHKPEQEWAFVREGDGVYRIRNRASGKLIDLMMTGTANGTWLHLWCGQTGRLQRRPQHRTGGRCCRQPLPAGRSALPALPQRGRPAGHGKQQARGAGRSIHEVASSDSPLDRTSPAFCSCFPGQRNRAG